MRNAKFALLLFLILIIAVDTVVGRARYSSAGTGTAKTQVAQDIPVAASNADTGSRQAGVSSSSIKPGEKDLLEDMLKESDVLNLLEQEQKKHEKRLKELQNRLERELQTVQEHFETIMTKLKKTEEQLELNLKNVEKSLLQQVKSSHERAEGVTGSWKWPFFILLLLLAGLGAFFGQLYRRATKGMRML